MAPIALLKRIRAFLKRNDMTATQFGLAAANNSSLIPRLESGKFSIRTLEKVESYLRRQKKRKARRI